MILGLTGSYGSGKSTVAEVMRSLGAAIIDADQIAHDVVEPGQPALEDIRTAFGSGVFLPDGRLDRPSLSRIVFSSPEKRRVLESIIHPRVRERELALLEHLRHHPLVVLNVPLLFENQLETHCDQTCVVIVSEEERERRLKGRDNATPDQVRRRLQAQMPQDEKIRRADFVIDNSGSPAETRKQVETIVKRIIDKRGITPNGPSD